MNVAIDHPGTGTLLHFHGSITATAVPLEIAAAVARLPAGSLLRVCGYPTDGGVHVRAIRAAFAQLGLGERLQIIDPLERNRLLALARTAQIGIAGFAAPGLNSNHDAMVGASNKVFDYLACGLAVLISDAPQWRSLLGGRDDVAFFEHGDVDSMVRGVEKLVAFRASQSGTTAAVAMPEQWTHEAQFAPVLRGMGVA